MIKANRRGNHDNEERSEMAWAPKKRMTTIFPNQFLLLKLEMGPGSKDFLT